MSEAILPVTVADLRNALAICAYNLEIEATRWRYMATHRKRGTKSRVEFENHARSLDRSARSVRAILAAPMTAQGVETTIAELARGKPLTGREKVT
jgi:hypothetical protein